MPSTATITAKFGIGASLTAQVFNNVTAFSFDLVNKLLNIEYNNDGAVRKLQIDINASTTFTLTLATGNYTLTIT